MNQTISNKSLPPNKYLFILVHYPIPTMAVLLNFIRLFSKLKLNVFVLIFGTFLIFAIPCLAILFSPIYLFRIVVTQIAKRCKPEFGKILTLQSTLLYAMGVYTPKPLVNLVISNVVSGSKTLDTWQTLIKHLVDLPDSSGNLKYPELRQYIHKWMGFVFWKWDKHFDINNHLTFLTPDKFTAAEANKFKSDLAIKPYNSKQSPWEFIIINNYEDEEHENISGPKSFIFFRIHHGVCDGFSMIKMFLNAAGSLSDSKNNELEKLLESHNHRESLTFKEMLIHFWRLLKVPYTFAYYVIDSISLKPWGVGRFEHKHEYICLSSKRISSDYIKEIKNGYKVGFTSVLLSALTSGVRKGLQMSKHVNRIPDKIYSGFAFPVPRHPDKLRNHAALGLVCLPIGEVEPQRRLSMCHKHLLDAKNSLVSQTAYFLSPILGGIFPSLITSMATNSVFGGLGLTSVPGPKQALKVDGLELLDISVVLSLPTSNVGVVFTIVTYVGGLRFTAVVDKAIFAEEEKVQAILDSIVQELDFLKAGLT